MAELTLRCCGLEDAGARDLATVLPLSRLTRLDVSANALSSDAIAALRAAAAERNERAEDELRVRY